MTAQKVNPELHTFHSDFESVVQKAISFFNSTPVHPLPPLGKFSAGGVYALYYLGTFTHYAQLAYKNRNKCTQPIYIGKAVLPGWRTARGTKTKESTALYSRLREHARNINRGAGLDTSDFQTRFIILDGLESDIVVPMEAALIRQFTPLWNSFVDGFGNHDPGRGRYNQARSEWDVLHPGRPWADRLTGESPNLKRIVNKIKNYTVQLHLF